MPASGLEQMQAPVQVNLQPCLYDQFGVAHIPLGTHPAGQPMHSDQVRYMHQHAVSGLSLTNAERQMRWAVVAT